MSDLVAQMTDPARSRIAARTAMVFAQPGHETVACGAQLARFDDLQFVLVTDGASGRREDLRRRGFESVSAYAQTRLQEFEEALALSGVSSRCAARLGLVEGAVIDHVDPLGRRLAEMLAGVEVIVTYGYQGGFGDCDAISLAVHSACDLMAESGYRPQIIETAVPAATHGAWAPPWVTATGGGHELVVALTPQEQDRKRAMAGCYRSQRRDLDGLALSEERFRIDRRMARRPAATGAGADWLNMAASAAGIAERREGARRLEDAIAVMREIAASTRGTPAESEVAATARAARRG